MPSDKPQRTRLSRIAYEHLVLPFVESEAPITHVSWGAAIGMFVGLTPTVGIQMYIVAMIWVLCRYLIRFHFNLPIAVALVWISNPVTVLPLYYFFFITGQVALALDFDLENLGIIHFAEFSRLFSQETGNPAETWIESVGAGAVLLFWTFGWPIVVGSLVWAIPISVLTYPLTTFALLKYRAVMARREGVTYAEWKRTHIRPD